MQTRWLASLLIFISSYAPLAAILAVQDFDLATGMFSHPWSVGTMLAAVVSCSVLNFVTLRSLKGGVKISVGRLANRTNELVNYTLPYIVSFLGVSLGDSKQLISFGIFMALMFLLTVRTQSLFINPLLALFGYSLYDAEFDDHGVTKQNLILAPRELRPGQICLVERLSPYLLFVTNDQLFKEAQPNAATHSKEA